MLPTIVGAVNSPLIVDVLNFYIPNDKLLKQDVLKALNRMNGMSYGNWLKQHEAFPRRDIQLKLEDVELMDITILKRQQIPIRGLVLLCKKSHEFLPWKIVV